MAATDTYRDHAASMRSHVDPQFMRQLSANRRPGLVVALTALVWLQLVAAIWVAATGPALAVVLAALVIVVQQHAMVLWVHEASHFNLFESRALNDFWGNFWFATPVGMNVVTYRGGHRTHHRDLAGDGDRDRRNFEFDIRGKGLWKTVAAIMFCYEGLRVAWTKYGRGMVSSDRHGEQAPQFNALAMSAFWNLLLLAVFALAGRWYLYFLVWLYPVLSVMMLITIMHTIAEHQPPGYDGVPATLSKHPITRTTLPGWFEKWAVFQTNFNFHLEHHVYPTVPFYNLPRLHAHLKSRGFYDEHPELLQGSLLQPLRRLYRNTTEPHAARA